MKKNSILAALSAAFILSTAPAFGQEDLWQYSYKLEAAGKYSEASAALDTVPASGADGEIKTLRRAWLFYLGSNLNESIREYRLAIDRNSKSIDARLGVILPLMAQKRWREAEQSSRAALEMAPNNYTALLRLAMSQEAQKDWSAMLRTSEAMVAGYPSDATAYVYLARSYAWMMKRDNAVAAYNAVLTRYPGHLEAKAYIEKK